MTIRRIYSPSPDRPDEDEHFGYASRIGEGAYRSGPTLWVADCGLLIGLPTTDADSPRIQHPRLTLDRADVTAHSATLTPRPGSRNSPNPTVPLPTAITIWRDFADVGVGMQLAPGALQ
jgi:hypothetical protein